MEESKLITLFYSFLENEKGFPKSSLLKQAPSYTIGGRRTEIDLLLIDVRIGNYIGQVEFKSKINPQIKNNVKAQTDLYAKAIKSIGIPTYLVYPIDENDFQILVYGQDDWISISKDEFPQFETLSAKKKIEEEIEFKELEEEKIKNFEIKKDFKKRASLWTLTSLILGILTAIFTFYISLKNKNEVSKPTLVNSMIMWRIDSLETQIDYLKKNNKIKGVVDTLFVIDSSKTHLGLSRRLETIESGIINNPEKTLALKNISQKIEILKQELINQEKTNDLKNQNLLIRIELLNALVIGMVLALITAAMGTVINNYYVKKNTNANTG